MSMRMFACTTGLLFIFIAGCDAPAVEHNMATMRQPPPGDWTTWSAYGGDPGGTRYAALSRINRDNVQDLQVAWTYSAGENDHKAANASERSGPCSRCHASNSKFEATPILAEGTLYVSTPLNRVIALDPETGDEAWRYDPHIKLDINRSEGFISRGVSFWTDRTSLVVPVAARYSWLP